jgi:sugar (pentulose or hexulose) kinase
MSTAQTNVLAFDLGATSGRAILGSLAGGKLEIQEIHRFPNEPVRANGELHWDILRLWHEMQAGLRLAGSQGRPPVASIGVDTWGVDYALLGERGALLENPYHYRDARTEGMVEKACGVVGADRIYDATGTQFMALNTLYQIYAASLATPRLLAAAEANTPKPPPPSSWTGAPAGGPPACWPIWAFPPIFYSPSCSRARLWGGCARNSPSGKG